MAIESSSSSYNACKKENKPIHLPIKIEDSDIDEEEEFQMIDNSGLLFENESNDANKVYGSLEARPTLINCDLIDNSNIVLENESNDNYEVYGSLEARPTSITEAQSDIKIEEVKFIPPDQISMDGNDATESQNYLQMQQNDTNSMFIESEIKAYLISNHDINARKSPTESTSFVGNGSMDISPLSDFATGDSGDFNLNMRSKYLCETGHSSLLTGPTCSKESYSEKYVKHLKKHEKHRKKHEKHQKKETPNKHIEIEHPMSNKLTKCTCNICNEKFTQLDDLKRHMELHSDVYSYTCTICFHSCKRREYLNNHVMRHHPESNIPPQYSSTEQWTSGVNIPKKYQCDYCGTQLRTFLTYQKHIKSIHPNEKHICKICNKEYYTLKSLTRHESLQHSGNDGPLKCDICLKSFKYLSQFTRHKMIHSDLPPQYSCSICSAQFRQKCNLDAHMRIHTEDNPFKYGMCSEEFVQPNLLKTHAHKFHSDTTKSGNINPLEKDESEFMNIDDRLEDFPTSSKGVVKRAKDDQESEVVELTEDNPIIYSSSATKEVSWDSQKNTPKRNQCGHCGKQFETSRNYKIHLHHHKKNKHRWVRGVNIPEKNQCDYCGKQLRSFFTYQRHMQSMHPNVKPPHTCKICNKAYYKLNSLNQHESREHSDSEKPHKCDICLKSFKLLMHLTQHKTVHSGLPPQHSCSICSAKFRHKGNLYAHMRNHTNVKPLKCFWCPKEFVHPDFLKTHTQRFHSNTTTSGNNKPLKEDDAELIKNNRLEYDCEETSEYESNMCINFPDESQQPSASKTRIRNTKYSISPQNIVNENSKAQSFSLPMENILKDASNSSTSITDSNFIDFIKVEEYQIVEQNVEELEFNGRIQNEIIDTV